MFYIKHIKTGNNPPENLARIIGAVRWCYQGEQVGGVGILLSRVRVVLTPIRGRRGTYKGKTKQTPITEDCLTVSGAGASTPQEHNRR